MTCSYITSYPYSLSRTSGWYGYRVCDIRVIVSGPHQRLPEVQNALGRLKNFTCTTSTHTEFDETYDADNESDYDASTDGNLSDNATDNDKIDTECDKCTTETDCILLDIIPTQRDFILISTDSDATPPATPPALLQQLLRLRHIRHTAHGPLTSTIRQDCDSDTNSSRTEPLSDITDATPPIHVPIQRLQQDNDTDATPLLCKHSDNEQDRTPLLTEMVTMTRRQQPKRLFATTDK